MGTKSWLVCNRQIGIQWPGQITKRQGLPDKREAAGVRVFSVHAEPQSPAVNIKCLLRALRRFYRGEIDVRGARQPCEEHGNWVVNEFC